MRYVLACSIVAAAVLLSGCGGGKKASSNGEASKSATQIVNDVKAAVGQAKSVHIVGSGTSTGTKLSIDLSYETGAKGGASGHVVINGLGFDIVRVNGKSYFKGDAAFLKHYAGPQAAQLMTGKWFYVADTVSGFSSLAALTNLNALTAAIFSTSGSVSKGDETKINGQPAIALEDKSNGGTLYVATTGPAYPLEIAPGGGAGSGKIDFEDWDKPVTLTAPKNPVDYAKLVGG